MLAAATRRFLVRSIIDYATVHSSPRGPGVNVYAALAGLLILVSFLIHLAYIASPSALDLAPDEAHYWLWSQHLDAGYYSKGPLVAWLIRGSVELLGDWSRNHLGSEAFAIRFPATICGSLLLVSIYVLTRRCFRDERLALLVLLFALTFPVLSVGQTIMTIDAPFTCCWGWALVLGHRVWSKASHVAWPVLGLVIGLGMLAKFTMILWPISFTLFLLASSRRRNLVRSRNFWLMLIVAAICCLPMLWWNWRHDWVSLRHLGQQSGLNDPVGSRWLGPVRYMVGQFGLLLGFWFVVWGAAMLRFWWNHLIPLLPFPKREGGNSHAALALGDASRGIALSEGYLWFLSAPAFFWFGLFSFITEVQLNWPVTAYLSGMVLAGAWLNRQWCEGWYWKRRALLGSAIGFGTLGLLMSIVTHNPSLIRPLLVRIAGERSADNPMPLRRVDPTCRIRGWQELGRQVDEIRADLLEEGIEPVIAASRWNYASELAFYCQGHPQVYSLGSALWDRQSQFDIWRPNPIADADQFCGRTFIFVDVGGRPPEFDQTFERVEPTRRIWYVESGQPIAFWDVTVCRAYRGMKSPDRKKY
jgi:4-amino-4-deoxy-L-arabinose transferase-like glycosyltransferase